MSKLRCIKGDPTLTREGRLQRLLRKLMKKDHFNSDVYYSIYLKGSQPARIYGFPKVHKEHRPPQLFSILLHCIFTLYLCKYSN